MTTSSQRRAHSRRLANLTRLAAEEITTRGINKFYAVDMHGKVDALGAVALAAGCPEKIIAGLDTVPEGPWGTSKKAMKGYDDYREVKVLLDEYVDGKDLGRNAKNFSRSARTKTQVVAMLNKAATWIESQD